VSDIFQEVDEEVRREQLKRLWERYGTLLIASCILVVAGVGAWRGYGWWEAKQAAQSGAAFEQAVSLAQAGKHQDAEAAFAKLATDGTAGYRVLARFREAAELAPTDSKAAVNAYDQIAADKNAGQAIQDLAAVRAGFLLVDSAPFSEIRTRLEPLTAADRTFRTDLIITDPQTPSGTRSRAEVLSELISAASSKG
jgi:hypothetical protein